VRNKKKACAECGMASFGTDLPEDATEQQVWPQKALLSTGARD
jgi:5,10-methylene-tetrahydrofolate dehydrogenase/methenyl tetrahydrofolate cyclohydrolase